MYRPTPEDFDDITIAAQSAEPFTKPDHKAKKHGRPPSRSARERRNEKIKGGHFVFRRGRRTGRIAIGAMGSLPFEHPSLESARTEAQRLQSKNGGRYDVFSVSSVVDGTSDDEWDCAPMIGDKWREEV